MLLNELERRVPDCEGYSPYWVLKGSEFPGLQEAYEAAWLIETHRGVEVYPHGRLRDAHKVRDLFEAACVLVSITPEGNDG